MKLKPMLGRFEERETRGEKAVGQVGFRSLDKNRAEQGPHLIRLVSVLLAVAVDSIPRCFLLLGQLGLGGQQGREGEETRGGGDGGEGWLAQAQR